MDTTQIEKKKKIKNKHEYIQIKLHKKVSEFEKSHNLMQKQYE